jgi:two-component system response regulator RegA
MRLKNMGTNPRLLIVDDDLEFLEILERRFSRRGFDVTARATYPDALEAAGKQTFDAAIVDRSVTGGADLELVGRLNSMNGNLPIIVLSGWNGPAFVAEARAAGAREYLTKPCALGEIEAAVRRVLGLRDTRLAETSNSLPGYAIV